MSTGDWSTGSLATAIPDRPGSTRCVTRQHGPAGDAGETVESVSAFLDHSSLAVTTVYLRRLEGVEDRSWREVAGAIRGVSEGSLRSIWTTALSRYDRAMGMLENLRESDRRNIDLFVAEARTMLDERALVREGLHIDLTISFDQEHGLTRSVSEHDWEFVLAYLPALRRFYVPGDRLSVTSPRDD